MVEEGGAGKSGEHPAAATKTTKKVPGVEVEDLPKAIVRRVVKDKLSRLSSGGGEGDVSVNKDALLAFSESTRVFIHYLSATANDICKESKRQTINADDVLNALEEIEFTEFVVPLKVSLEEMMRKSSVRRKNFRRRANEPSSVVVVREKKVHYTVKVNELSEYRKKNAAKKSGVSGKEAVKKRKIEDSPIQDGE